MTKRISGSGTLRLEVPTIVTVTDQVGNLLASLPFSGGQTYTVNKVYRIYLPLVNR